MSRILIVSEVFHPENFLVNDLAMQWRRDGHDVEVLTQHPSYPYGKVYPGYKNRLYRREEWNGMTLHRFFTVQGYRDSKWRKMLNYLVFVVLGTCIALRFGKRYDYLFVSQTGPLTVALPAVAVRKRFRKPLTLWVCDLWPDAVYAYGFRKTKLLTRLLDGLVRHVYRNSDHILASSEGFIDRIREYAPGKEVVYAPNWLQASRKTECPVRLAEGVFNFTFAGNISVAQNLEHVVESFCRADLPEAVLNIVGDGSRFEALQRLKERLHADNVRLWGRRPYDEMDGILRRSDALVLPLIPDGGLEKTEPLKFQAYLTAGRPILCVIDGPVKKIVEEYGLGLYGSPSDPEALAEAFRRMTEFAHKYRPDVATAAQTLLKERFDRGRIIERIGIVMQF